jgi:hypothetical protein
MPGETEENHEYGQDIQPSADRTIRNLDPPSTIQGRYVHSTVTLGFLSPQVEVRVSISVK